MARSPEDIIKDRLEDTRLEIERQQAIIENDRKSFKEKEAARKRQTILIERELSILEKIATLEERRAKNAAREAERAQKAAERQEELADSYVDKLQQQIRQLNIKKEVLDKTNKKLKESDQKLLDLATEYQEKIKENPEHVKKLIKEHRTLVDQLEDELEVKKQLKDLDEKQAIYESKRRAAQVDATKSYVDDLEKNIRKTPVIGDLLANTLMGPKAKHKLANQFYKFFKNPAFKKKMAAFSKGLSVVVSGALVAISEEEWWKKVQRAFATTNDQIKQYRDNIYRTSVNSELELATRENLVEATNELSGVYGKLALTDMKRLEDQVMLTKYLGLQGEEAAEIQRLGTIQGKNAEVVTQEVAAQVEGFNKLTGAGFVFNDIMKDVAKSSEEVKLIFKGSAKELASAIVTVKGLGLELSDVQQTADHLLDIESSVTKQVQAQIVTGKQINLDKARQLAFNNDLVGVAGELVKQGVTYKELTEGNRIGNKLLADSLGMPLETLSKMVLEQEKFKELGVDISKGVLALTDADRNRLEYLAAMGNETAKQTIEQMKQATVQEKLNKAMSDIKNIIAEIAVILLPALHILANIVGFLAKYKTLIYGIIGFMAGGIPGAILGATGGFIADVYDRSTSMQPVQTPTPGITGASTYYKETTNTNTVSVNTKETNDLLKQLINKVDQPVNVNIGDRAINQINNNIGLKRSYTPGVNRLS